jgi:hypothetical protein
MRRMQANFFITKPNFNTFPFIHYVLKKTDGLSHFLNPD